MLVSELNLKALNINASSVLPVCQTLNVEGHEIEFKITDFRTGFGSGKKSVISGSIKRLDNNTKKSLENADIEKVRRVVSSLCELTQSGRTTERKPRTSKEQTEVDKLRQNLAVARRLPKEWCKIDTNNWKQAFKDAREMDRENVRKALQARAVAPILERVAKLNDEERALLLASLQ